MGKRKKRARSESVWDSCGQDPLNLVSSSSSVLALSSLRYLDSGRPRGGSTLSSHVLRLPGSPGYEDTQYFSQNIFLEPSLPPSLSTPLPLP